MLFVDETITSHHLVGVRVYRYQVVAKAVDVVEGLFVRNIVAIAMEKNQFFVPQTTRFFQFFLRLQQFYQYIVLSYIYLH